MTHSRLAASLLLQQVSLLLIETFFFLQTLLLGLVWLSTATIAASFPAVANQAAQVLAQLQNQPSSPYTRLLLNERTRRGLFSSLAGIATSGLVGNKEPTDEEGASALKPSKKPYDFNEVEMTAIQAMISLRDIIGDILQRVGLNIPSLASLITRSEGGPEKGTGASAFLEQSSGSPLSGLTSTKSTNLGVQVLRGLALSLPLLIPMATQIRRMSPDHSASIPLQTLTMPQLPVMSYPDMYFNQAMHRRRGKRSLNLGHDQEASQLTVPVLSGSVVQHLLNNRQAIPRYLWLKK